MRGNPIALRRDLADGCGVPSPGGEDAGQAGCPTSRRGGERAGAKPPGYALADYGLSRKARPATMAERVQGACKVSFLAFPPPSQPPLEESGALPRRGGLGSSQVEGFSRERGFRHSNELTIRLPLPPLLLAGGGGVGPPNGECNARLCWKTLHLRRVLGEGGVAKNSVCRHSGSSADQSGQYSKKAG